MQPSPLVGLPTNLPEGVQEQVNFFLSDYPKSGPELVSRYLKLVLSDEYGSRSMGRSETHQVDTTRPRPRNRAKKINERKPKPKTNCQSTSKSARVK